MPLPNKQWVFITEYIKVKELQHGDLILHDNADIDEVQCFSGFVLILKPLLNSNPEQVNRCYLWNVKDKLNNLIQIIKDNADC